MTEVIKLGATMETKVSPEKAKCLPGASTATYSLISLSRLGGSGLLLG